MKTSNHFLGASFAGGCLDWWLNDIGTSIPYIVNGLADAGALLCMHDSYRSTCEGIGGLIKVLTVAEPQTTVNPQVSEDH